MNALDPLRRGADAVVPSDGRKRIERARDAATAALLAERNASGWWVGELSSSALSTATAVTALTIYLREAPQHRARLHGLVDGGCAWLVQHQNVDGGWGDTTKSFSNISTTTLVWAALDLVGVPTRDVERAVAAAERWLAQAAGSLEPDAVVHAIERRYGKDRTFSIPILTMCALCGRLGAGAEGWRRVRPLPFEVAALPQRWFGALQLPVVSYALPALIAIGQVRHAMAPSRNPLWRAVRERCRAPTLEKLSRLQPPNGGFLEAAPLTSFVTMSLAASGRHSHPVVERGVAFLEASVRPDGSWPIDTNLATWVTTLAVNALAAGDASTLDAAGRRRIIDWLVAQQYRREHPYTLAAPGGWAWTDLPGGVPDADDTPGALLALHALAPSGDAQVVAAARAGVAWLVDLQNRDGGLPTFCRGWGKLPFDRSSPDLTAHAMRAWRAWLPHLADADREKTQRAVKRATDFLLRCQRPNGSWVPLWFGHQESPEDENPLYGTARVVPALCELEQVPVVAAPMERALRWLVDRQRPDGGWCGAPEGESSTEETALAVEALAMAWAGEGVGSKWRAEMSSALTRGGQWLAEAVERGTWREPAPIGFYFAKLWYFERLYPQIFATGALRRLAALRI